MVEKESVQKCCVHFWRILFFILNAFFFVIGLGLIGLSIYLLATQNDLSFITGSNIASGGALILIAGLITAIISLIGILGALGKWSALLIVYTVLLFIIVILEIVAGILGFVYRMELIDIVAVRASDTISQYREANAEDARRDVNTFVDYLQGQFKCCGYSSSDNWLSTMYYNSTLMYPGSCNCTGPMESGGMDICELGPGSQMIYIAACNNTVNDFLRSNLGVIGGVGIAFGLFQVIGIGIAIALTCCFCAMRKKDDDDFTKPL